MTLCAERKPYSDLARAGVRLRGLMRSLLFKRLESSVEAFRLTVAHLIESHVSFSSCSTSKSSRPAKTWNRS